MGGRSKRRGLPNIGCMVDAVEALTSEQTIELFENLVYLQKQNWNPEKKLNTKLTQKQSILKLRL